MDGKYALRGTILALTLLWAAALVFCTLAPPPAVEAEVAQPTEQPPKLIALTFDDGPRRLTTTRLLDGLEERGVSATFFLIGKQIPDNEDLILRMEAEGHEVGIHTFDHVPLTGLNAADFDAQVGKTRRILQGILYRDDFLLRPPFGYWDEAVQRQSGAPIILWSIDPEDWGDQNSQREIRHILKNAKDGSIILLHDIFPASVDAALAVVDELSQEGYVFLTVSDLFAARGIPLENGIPYRHAYPSEGKIVEDL